MGRLRRLIAVAWAMPPMVLPRAIQTARSLKALHRRGWTSDVVSAPEDVLSGTTLDHRFSALYGGHYRSHIVEYREAVRPSSWPRRAVRRWRPPIDINEDNWIRRAGTRVLGMPSASGADVLVTFAQPWMSHQVGRHVKRRRPDLPWLAHFSDPWVDSPYFQDDGSDGMAARIREARVQEEAIIRDADAIVFVTRQTADLVMGKYPQELAAKVHVVPHGFDRDAASVRPAASCAPAGAPSNDRRPLRLVHTGNIYAGIRDPRSLFQALRLLGGGGELKGRIEVAFYGNAPAETLAALEASGLEGIVTFGGAVGYLESLRIAAEADVLLLIDADAEVNVFLPSKVVDYLMLGRPILAMTPKNGATADALAGTGHAVLPPGDVEELARLLSAMIERHERGEAPLTTKPDAAERFDIRRTTTALEAALDAAIEAAADRRDNH